MLNSDTTNIPQFIERARQGDPEALGDLMERYRPFLTIKVQQEIGPKLRKRVDAADVVQIAFVEACQDINKFRGNSENEFSAWLQQIVINRFKNVIRDNKAAKRDPAKENTWRIRPDQSSTSICWMNAAAHTSTASKRLIEGERALKISAALAQLPDAQRLAVTMRHLQGMTLADIAEQLERSPEATAGLLKRGLAKLRSIMNNESFD